MKGSTDAAVALLVEKDVVNPLLVEQVPDADIAEGGTAAAGIEKNGEYSTVTNTPEGIGRRGIEKVAGFLAGEARSPAVTGNPRGLNVEDSLRLVAGKKAVEHECPDHALDDRELL
jgi:hypothetical protein